MIKILTVIINSKYRILTLLFNDFLIGVFSLVLSVFILNGLDESVLFLKNHALLFFTIPLLKVTYFFIARLYSISWRYASLRDIAKTFNTITITMLALLLSTTVSELIHPRMVIIDFLIYMGIFFFSRFTLKVLRLRYSNTKVKNSKKYVIIGAGDAGEMVARELLKIESQDSIIGFFDDNELLHKKTIHQAPVIGPILTLPDFFQSNHFDQIIIAIPSASSSEFRKILDVCKSVNVPFLTTPSINELLDNTVKLNKLRDVSIVDLLGRSLY